MIHKKLPVIIIVLALIAVIGAYQMMPSSSPSVIEADEIRADETAAAPAPEAQTQNASAATKQPITEQLDNGDIAPAAGTPNTPLDDNHNADTMIDLESAMALRTLGNPDAPVVLEEFASLSCSHCASFHKENFDRLKEEYIDTGKVYFIYHDFPLNAPALEAAMIARCMPQDQYHRFIKFLFTTQDDWAFQPNYRRPVRQNAKLLGANDQLLDACLAHQDLRQALIAHMQDMSKTYEITSTPSFAMNGEKLFTGNQPYERFKAAIDSVLAESEKTPSSETSDDGKDAE